MNGSEAFGPPLPFLFGLAGGETGMPRKKLEVRAVRDDGIGMQGCVPRAAPRPVHCKRFARARFAEALPEIMQTLLDQVKTGSVPHLKVVLELTGLDKAETAPRKDKREEKSLEAILLEQWRKDEEQANKEQENKKQENGTAAAVP